MSEPNLYVVKVVNNKGESLVKLGYSSNMDKRLTQYRYHNPLIEVIGTYYKEDAYEFEQAFHRAVPATVMNEWYAEHQLPVIMEAILTGKIPSTEVEHKAPVLELYLKANNILLGVLPNKFYTAFIKLVTIALEHNLHISYLHDSVSYTGLSEFLGIYRNDVPILKETFYREDIIRTVNDCWAVNPYIVKAKCDIDVINAFSDSKYRYT